MDADLVVLLAVDTVDGSIRSPGDAVTERYSNRPGVLQSVHSNGMVTVSMGPGRVAVARPERFRLMVTGLGPCCCAGTLGEVNVWSPGARCPDQEHQAERTHAPTVPHLDDLI